VRILKKKNERFEEMSLLMEEKERNNKKKRKIEEKLNRFVGTARKKRVTEMENCMDGPQLVEIKINQQNEATLTDFWFKRVFPLPNNIGSKRNYTSKVSLVDTNVIVPKRLPNKDVYTPIITMNWLNHIEELKEFKEQFGHCNVSRKNLKWKSLGHWVRQQRRKRKNGKLNDTQISVLEKMGFEWDRSYYLYSKVPHRHALNEIPIRLNKKKTKEEQ